MDESNQDRELILANFQAITGIEDISISLATLEEFNWDIDSAIVAAVSEEHNAPAPHHTTNNSINTSFKVDWKGREQLFSLCTSTTTIGTLKEMLSNRVGIPHNQFTIIGFPSLQVQTDYKTLEEMGVAVNTALVMVELDVPQQSGSSSNYKYRFKINIDGLEHDLVFPASNLIGNVKSYIESTYNIPVSRQKWEGWPPGTSDSLELRDVVIEMPYHRLKVSRSQRSIHDSEEEMEEELESPAPCTSTATSQQPLMTVGKSSEDNIIQFIHVFESRYGPVHPSFHIGTLKSAMTAAFNVPADRKQPLIVFLHSDHALTAHLFCSQVLCCESISQYIDENFVFWGHDLTEKRLEQQILAECQSIFGLDGRRQVEFYIPAKLPLMIVITKVASSPQVFSVFQGDISSDLLMAQLMDAVENYTQTRSIEKAAELEQEQRSMLRAQQEHEYLDSLQRDQEKEEIKKIEEKEKELNEATEHAKLSSFVDLVPPEPDQNIPSSDITFKLPSGERINRKFGHHNKLKILLYFVGSKGYPPSHFKLVQNFPKRQFDADEMELTLEDLGLTRREILYVEEMD